MLLSLINIIVPYLYGSSMVISFVDIVKNKKDVALFSAFSLASVTLQFIIFINSSVNVVIMFYPLVVHLPLLLFAVLYYKRRVMPTIIAIMLACNFTLVRNCIGIIFVNFVPNNNNAKTLFMTLITPVLLFLIFKFITPYIRKVLELSSKQLNLIFIPSVMVYIFMYLIFYRPQLFDSVRFNSNTIKIVVSIIVIAVYIYIILALIKIYSENELQESNKLMKLQHYETEKMINEMQSSQKDMAIIRHDLRHYLSIIDSLAENNQADKICEYIGIIEEKLNSTIVKNYCNNEPINLVLVHYEKQAELLNIDVNIFAKIDMIDSERELDFCMVLSNAFENAINAAKSVDNPFISINIGYSSNKIILLIKNKFNTKKKVIMSTPDFGSAKHGIGTYSIKKMAEEHGGIAEFNTEDDTFILKLIM